MNLRWTLLLSPFLLLALAGPLLATNTSNKKKTKLRVVLHGGKSVVGPLVWKETYLKIRRKKVPYQDISSIERVEPSREAQIEQFQKRKKSVKESARALIRLARWAQERGLWDEAADACVAALELEPENEQALRGSGQAKDGDKWVPVGIALAKKRKEAKDPDAIVDLARFARKHGAHETARDLCVQVLLKDTYHKDALRVIKPATDAYQQLTKLRLPIAGTWKASEDRTRHHQKKGYAVYALDLTMVDAKGKHHKGSGKKLSDHYAWDAPFYAVADGTVVEVRDGFEDNPIGKIGDKFEKHNGVSVDHGNGEISWYVHAKKDSIVVKVGDKVTKGQLLGTVGNSGGSAVPHLHYTLVSFRGISVPWRCEEFEVIAPDGTPIRMVDMWPREGWILKGKPGKEAPGK